MNRRLGLAIALVLVAVLATLGVVFFGTPESTIEQEDSAPGRSAERRVDDSGERGARRAPQTGDAIIGGRVVGANDRPLIGALVRLSSQQSQPIELHAGGAVSVAAAAVETLVGEARTDDEGHFSFDVDSGQTYIVEARVTGLTRGREESVEPGRTDLLLRLVPGARVRGVVVAEGEGPLDRVTVSGPGVRSSTHRDGRFTLDGLEASKTAQLTVEAVGFETATIPIPLAAGETVDLPDLIVLTRKPGVAGRVLDPTGDPLAAVMVYAGAGFNLMAQGRKTDEAGRFWFAAADIADERTMTFKHSKYLVAKRAAIPFRPGVVHVLEDLHLEVGGTIVGRILGDGDRPIAGATLIVLPAEPTMNVWMDITLTAQNRPTSAADGTFRIDGLDAGEVHLHVTAKGHVRWKSKRVTIVLRTETTIDVQLSTGLSISGVVKDSDGNPIEGATVSGSVDPMSLTDQLDMMLAANSPTPNIVLTDGAGHFTLTGFAEGKPIVSAEKVGYAKISTTVAAGTMDVELTLVTSGGIAGRVVADESDEPIAGGHVTLQDGTEWKSAMVEEDGSFKFERVTPGVHTLNYDNDQTSPRPPAAVEAITVTSGKVTDVVVRVPRGAELAGIVVGPTGAVVEGAAVAVDLGQTQRTAKSEADGRFVLRGLSEGAHRVTVTSKGFARWSKEGVLVPGAEELRVEMFAGGTIVGVARNEEGPIVGAMVLVPSMGGRSMGVESMTQTGQDGRFRITDLPAGRHTVMLIRPRKNSGVSGMMPDSRSAEVKAGEETFVEFDFTEQASSGKSVDLTARLLDRNGDPLGAGVMVILMRMGADPGKGIFEQFKQAVTNDQGKIELKGLPTGRYRVFSGGPRGISGGQELDLTAPGATATDVAMAPGVVRGTVVDAKSGEPIPNAMISLVDPRAANVSSVSFDDFMLSAGSRGSAEEDGTFELGNVRPGTYQLQCSAEGRAAASFPITVGETAGASVRAALEPGVPVTFRARAAGGGAPLAQAGISLFDADGVWLLVGVNELDGTKTESNGEVEIRMMPRRSYEIVVQKAGYASVRRKISIGSGAKTIELEFTPGATATIEVSAGGSPAVGARARVWDSKGVELFRRPTNATMMAGDPHGVSGEGGKMPLLDLPAGTLRVEITAPDGRKGNLSLTAVSGEATVAAIALE